MKRVLEILGSPPVGWPILEELLLQQCVPCHRNIPAEEYAEHCRTEHGEAIEEGIDA